MVAELEQSAGRGAALLEELRRHAVEVWHVEPARGLDSARRTRRAREHQAALSLAPSSAEETILAPARADRGTSPCARGSTARGGASPRGLLAQRDRGKEQELALGALEPRLDEHRAPPAVHDGALDHEPRAFDRVEELDVHVQRDEPPVGPPALAGAHRAERDEIDVRGREAAEEVIAEVPDRGNERHVDHEPAGRLLDEEPLRPAEEVAGRVPRAHETAGRGISPHRADVTEDGHGQIRWRRPWSKSVAQTATWSAWTTAANEGSASQRAACARRAG